MKKKVLFLTMISTSKKKDVPRVLILNFNHNKLYLTQCEFVSHSKFKIPDISFKKWISFMNTHIIKRTYTI